MAKKVNLDALIPREDFEATESINSGKKKETISIEDIKSDSFFFVTLRKPDFQRETNEWDSSKISELIKSFISGDLIPAIILWRSPSGLLFVIDGSHRLSALHAWVNNDYGDGSISKAFYDGLIPDEQIEIAEETRALVNKNIGSYDDFRLALTRPDKVRADIVQNAKNLAALAIQLQWVEGDARTAESSFFKINQQAAPIDKTELKLLESRKHPNSIAARAIIRSGKGHRYWASFDQEIQDQIQQLASEINKILFTPTLKTPIKTLDLPIGGRVYSTYALPLVVDFINIVCQDIKFKKDDEDGNNTIQCLKDVKKVAERINSNKPASLGLHPAVYFYSIEGRHKSASFFAMVDYIINLDIRKKIDDFIEVRKLFENFIVEYDYLIQQINRRYRYAQKSYKYISEFFYQITYLLKEGKNFEDVIVNITNSKSFSYLAIHKITEEMNYHDFNTEKKSAIFMVEALENTTKCKICEGLIHVNSISIDHIKPKKDGGIGSFDNGQLTHPYCNTGYKNKHG